MDAPSFREMRTTLQCIPRSRLVPARFRLLSVLLMAVWRPI
jgi:hypothetical protein